MDSKPDDTTDALRAAEAAAADPEWIDTPDALAATVSKISENAVIGIDTEFVRERTFWAQPGLLQLSDGRHVWLVDLTAINDFRKIAQLLEDPEIVKVLHSPGEDLEVLHRLCGALPRPLFDTQVAAACLGSPLQMGYEKLLEQELGVALEGGKARSDWLKRPLADDLKAYAAQDVAWLPLLQRRLGEKLQARERLGWVLEECDAMLAGAVEDVDETDLVARVKGAGRLDDAQLTRLTGLAAWRDREARRRDLPRSFVARDEDLLRLARHGSPSPTELAGIDELPEKLVRRHAGALATALAEEPLRTFRRPPALEALDADSRHRLKTLQTAVARVAEELGVEPALVASKRDLIRHMHGGDSVLDRGWRAPYLADLLTKQVTS